MRQILAALLWMAIAPAVLAQLPSPAQPSAPSPSNAEAYEAGRNAWVEQEVALPAYPKTAGLVEIRTGSLSGNRFLIDADTLSIGKDGVVRYALVVRSAAGAENVSFEGMRCATREQKYYAFGQRSGSWSGALDAQWRPIEAREINRHHAVLFFDYLCTDGARPPRAVREVVQRLRYGRL